MGDAVTPWWTLPKRKIEPGEFRVSDRGLLEIAEHEGIVPAPYLDSVGVWTWGIGHTAAAGDPVPALMAKGMPTNLEAVLDEVLAVFRRDIATVEAQINKWIAVPLAQHEIDALASFEFNTGGIRYFKGGEWRNAKLVDAINAGLPDASRHFMGWKKPPEIIPRRKAEMRLFETGDYDRNGTDIPVWRTNGQGVLLGRAMTIPGSELLARMERQKRRWSLPNLFRNLKWRKT